MTSSNHQDWINIGKYFSYDNNIIDPNLQWDIYCALERNADIQSFTPDSFKELTTMNQNALKARVYSDAMIQYDAIRDAHEHCGERRSVRCWAKLYSTLCVYIEKWYTAAIESGRP
jgi:hypothetical protein